MLQVEKLRGRLSEWNPRAQWVQLGLLSASIMAPLVGRWNELRAAERARALREEAEARLRGMRVQLPWQRNDVFDQVAVLLKQPEGKVIDKVRTRSKVSTRLWLVGVSVGLIAAGAGAYLLVRRRMERNIDEPLVDLPVPSINGYAKGASNGLNGTHREPSATPVAGVASPAAAAPNVPVASVASNELPSTQSTTQSAQADAQSGPANGTPDDNTTEATSKVDEAMPVGVAEQENAPFIGNIRTMIYHPAGDYNLPAEENRIYFASEDEARAAGYHRGYNAAQAAEAESQAQSNI